MPNHHPYPNAPITEALVDLRVAYGPDISLEKLQRFGTEIKRDYPHEGMRQLIQGQIDLAGASQATKTMLGYIFHSADRLQAVQARLDGFTFSRLKPYEDWPHLINEAKRLWALFVKFLSPRTVQRVAVRYINQINLPLQDGNLRFEDYLRTFPATGLEEGVTLEQFFMRLVMPQNDLSAKLILNEALLPPSGNQLGVILDIDLFKENLALDVHSEEIWAILETFRGRKNEYFEASITPATRRLFA